MDETRAEGYLAQMLSTKDHTALARQLAGALDESTLQLRLYAGPEDAATHAMIAEHRVLLAGLPPEVFTFGLRSNRLETDQRECTFFPRRKE